MKKKPFQKVLSVFLASLLLFFTFSDLPGSYASQDVTAKLQNLLVSVQQDGVEISDSSTPIDAGKPFTVTATFDVPVKGDGLPDTETVAKGDTAVLVIAQGAGFDLQSPANVEFKAAGDVKVGSGVIQTDAPQKKMLIQITFDGEDQIFDGSVNSVSCGFSATLKYAGLGEDAAPGTHVVTILNKTFTFHVAEPPLTVAGTKSGILSGSSILWKVTANAQKSTGPALLDSLTFSDDLSAVGDFVSGSLRVGGPSDSYDAAAPVSPSSVSGSLLKYDFPAGTGSEATVYFLTKIKDSDYYANKDKEFTNTAKIFEGTEEKSSMTGKVPFRGKWIEKAATEIDKDTRMLVWSITANPEGFFLPNAVIEEKMSENLELVSATLAKKPGADWTAETPISPAGVGTYNLGDINTPVLLKVKTKVKDGVNIQHILQKVTNSAILKWDGGPGIGTGVITASIGFNPISKSAGAYDRSAHTVPWTVTVKESDVNINLRVLDLLVYGSAKLDPATLDATSGGSGLAGFTLADLQKTPQQFNQKYKAGSFSTVSGNASSCDVYHLTKGGKPVADLLVVTDTGKGLIVTSGAVRFKFESIVTNPELYASNSNEEKRVYNTAALFSANTRVNMATSSRPVSSKMLLKDMLTAADAMTMDSLSGINGAAAAADKGFNYLDKSIVFRLHINSNGLTDMANDLTGEDGTSLGAITLTDTLPDGWVFQEIQPGKNFLLFEGTGATTGAVKAQGSPVDSSAFMTPDFSAPGKAVFTFANIQKPYVLFLKAGPTKETAAEYFKKNNTFNLENKASLKADQMSVPLAANQKMVISSRILSKKMMRDAASVLKWTVEYRPYDIGISGAALSDVLPPGLDLRAGADGKLIIAGNIFAKELILNADGTYSDGPDIPLEAEKNIFYDNATRTLKFVMPDPQKAYKLTYKTDITADPGTSLKNKVFLLGFNMNLEEASDSYLVADSDAWAIMNKSGWLEITKKGNHGASLGGAEFTLYASDGVTIVRQGVSDGAGKLIFRGLPIGTYILKETAAPPGYDLSMSSYSVEVRKKGIGAETLINGGSNKITINNFETGTTGQLKIGKTISGSHADPTADFIFIISAGALNASYPYSGSGGKTDGSLTFTNGKATFTLKGGQAVTLILPGNLPFEVTEQDYSNQGYATTSTGNTSGVIEVGVLKEASFNNYRYTGRPTRPFIGVEIPDPNVPGSPATVVVDKEGTPVIYTKVQKPDGTFEYIDPEGVPLGAVSTPQTGKDFTGTILLILMLLSLAGAGALWQLRRRYAAGGSRS